MNSLLHLRSFPLACLLVTLALCCVSGAEKVPVTRDHLELPAQIKTFCADKERQARALVEELQLDPPEELWSYFAAAKAGDWAVASDLSAELLERNRPPTGEKPWKPMLLEVQLALEAYADGEAKSVTAFGQDIVNSIPRGSIYFGGTDPGRGLVTAFSKAHEQGDPFFTLTQNALADGTYLTYLRKMYGAKISIPTQADSNQAFKEYLADATQRFKDNKLKPGEDVRETDGRIQVGGQVAVMSINALLVKNIFEGNPQREFYIEESFPLDWMYPHLSPHGLILKLNREPLASLSTNIISKDREFWTRRCAGMIGDWLKPETTVAELCDFITKVHEKQDYTGFKGDRKFIENDYATKTYSKLRKATAGLYAWRAQASKDAAETKRMNEASDFAFRQALALDPTNPEAIFGYVNLLIAQTRFDDGQLVVRTAKALNPKDAALRHLGEELQRAKAR